MRLRTGLLSVAVAGAFVAAGGAATCKFASVDCGIRSSPQEASQTKLPDGFRQEVVLTGLREPTDLAFLPEGRVAVAERAGLVRVADARNQLAPTPLLDLRQQTNTQYFRGLVAIALDPDYERNGHLYALYVREDRSGPANGPRTVRLSRFTVDGDRADVAGERVILGADGRASCDDLPDDSDCLPSNVDHVGGDILFARDGTMFVSTGDGGGEESFERTALTAQSVDALGGKVLRITRDGKGVEGNPYWNGDPDANRSKVWGIGLRNPFRMTLHPETGIPYVGDVGQKAFEEIDVVPRRSNNGWPCYEGTTRQPLYRTSRVCRRLYARGARAARRPLIAYGRKFGVSVTLGLFYTGSNLPSEYRGRLIYGDWTGKWLRRVRLEPGGEATAERPQEWATNVAFPSAIASGDDDKLYYLSYTQGELRRISYEP